MNSFSLYHWAAIMLYFVIPALLFSRIVRKAGMPKWWALLGLLPLVNVVALWLFAFAEWPRDRGEG